MNEQKPIKQVIDGPASKSIEPPYEKYMHDSVDAFLKIEAISDGRHSIDHGYEVRTDLLVFDRKSQVTVITFNGAADTGASRPYFQATGMLNSLEQEVGPLNRIQVHDGLLAHHHALRIGWYLGTPQVDLSSQLTTILERVLRQLRRGPVIIFGSSAGGFAALTQGEALPNTIVVSANPQTILERYEPNLYRKWLETGGWLAEGGAFPTPKDLKARTDLRARLGPYRPHHTYLLLNINDKLHVGSHAIPWLQDVAGGRDVSVLVGREWGPGHAPAPRKLLEPFLKNVIESSRVGKQARNGGNLGKLISNATLAEVNSNFCSPEVSSESLGAEIDIHGQGVRFSVRNKEPGLPVTVNVGLRSVGRPIFRTHLVSMELEKDGKEYKGPMKGAVWSSDPNIQHFVYLPLREGHSRFAQTFTPPAGVSIVGVRFCQWVKKTKAQVFLTDVKIMGSTELETTSEVEQGKDGQSS